MDGKKKNRNVIRPKAYRYINYAERGIQYTEDSIGVLDIEQLLWTYGNVV